RWGRLALAIMQVKAALARVGGASQEQVPPTPQAPHEPALTLDRYVLHGSTRVTGLDPLSFETPAERWAYALELPAASVHDGPEPSLIRVGMQVSRGAVGVGCLGADGNFLVEVERTHFDGRTDVELRVPALADCTSLMFRNTSADYAPSTAQVWS